MRRSRSKCPVCLRRRVLIEQPRQSRYFEDKRISYEVRLSLRNLICVECRDKMMGRIAGSLNGFCDCQDSRL